MRYTVVLIPDRRDGGFVAYVPAIPGCVTQGESVEGALAMAQDAAETLLADMDERDGDLPTETEGTVIASIDVRLPERAVAVA